MEEEGYSQDKETSLREGICPKLLSRTVTHDRWKALQPTSYKWLLIAASAMSHPAVRSWEQQCLSPRKCQVSLMPWMGHSW